MCVCSLFAAKLCEARRGERVARRTRNALDIRKRACVWLTLADTGSSQVVKISRLLVSPTRFHDWTAHQEALFQVPPKASRTPRESKRLGAKALSYLLHCNRHSKQYKAKLVLEKLLDARLGQQDQRYSTGSRVDRISSRLQL